MDPALRLSLPLLRRRKRDAPRCPCCFTRMLAGSSPGRITYYYPQCLCPGAASTKVTRRPDASRVPATAVA